ncbi:MAG: hypothetical protein U1E72_03605 [Burkholderiaceae bacterium]
MNDPVQAFKLAMLAALGHAPELIEPGRLQRFATSDKRGDSAGCKLFVDLRGGVYGCNRAGVSEGPGRPRPTDDAPAAPSWHRQIGQATAERESEQRQQWAVNAERIKRLWAQCVPLVPGDPVTLYLKRRGFGGVAAAGMPAPASCAALLERRREDRGVPGDSGALGCARWPSRFVASHVPGGGRSQSGPAQSQEVPTATAGPLAGACIPLHEPQRGVIGIAEGIENRPGCLAGVRRAHGGRLLGGQPGGVAVAGERAAAGDLCRQRPGQAEADELRARAFCRHRPSTALTSSDDGADWCDVGAARCRHHRRDDGMSAMHDLARMRNDRGPGRERLRLGQCRCPAT